MEELILGRDLLVVRSIAFCLSNSVSISNYYLFCISDFHITGSGTNVYDYVIMKYFFLFQKNRIFTSHTKQHVHFQPVKQNKIETSKSWIIFLFFLSSPTNSKYIYVQSRKIS